MKLPKSVTLPEQQLFLLLNLQKLLPHNILPLFYYVVLMKDQWKEDLLLLKTAQLFLIDLLYAEVYKTLGKKALDNKQKTAQIITEKMM